MQVRNHLQRFLVISTVFFTTLSSLNVFSAEEHSHSKWSFESSYSFEGFPNISILYYYNNTPNLQVLLNKERAKTTWMKKTGDIKGKEPKPINHVPTAREMHLNFIKIHEHYSHYVLKHLSELGAKVEEKLKGERSEIPAPTFKRLLSEVERVFNGFKVARAKIPYLKMREEVSIESLESHIQTFMEDLQSTSKELCQLLTWIKHPYLKGRFYDLAEGVSNIRVTRAIADIALSAHSEALKYIYLRHKATDTREVNPAVLAKDMKQFFVSPEVTQYERSIISDIYMMEPSSCPQRNRYSL